MEKKYTDCAVRILNGLGIAAGEDCIRESFVSNTVETRECVLHGTKIRAEVVLFEDGDIRIDIDFYLPEDGVLADAFMEHCAAIEKIPTNIGHHYCHGPRYRDYSSELHGRNTFAYSPWHGHGFYVRSERYTADQLGEAEANAVALARMFSAHLGDLASLRYWKSTDPEVVARAKEIVAGADFEETDCDPEEKAHWLVDRKSFFKGWFYPFNDRGRGTFDTVYRPFYGAIGIEGSFEYAVSCLLLFDRDYIAKARKACRIRERVVQY